MKLVLASKNAKKLVEMNDILSHLGVAVCSEAEAGVDLEVEETGTTFEENSLLKAKAVMEASGLPAIADDSGLCVDCLNGAPGVYSARYGGEGLSDPERYRMLLDNMRGQMTRTAKFVSVITCCFPNGDVLSARGECPGTIAYAPMGEGGFGYDPVFFVPELKKTFAQLTADEKNAVSHRGRALEAFKEKLEDYLRLFEMNVGRDDPGAPPVSELERAVNGGRPYRMNHDSTGGHRPPLQKEQRG